MKTKIKIKNLRSGERFEFCGFEWVLLGDEQSGKLAVMADIIDEYPFDKNNKNDWRKSSLRAELNEKFIKKLDTDALLPFVSDLTADDGLKDYGTSEDLVFLLSCDLYRKYRAVMPKYNTWVWTITPYSTHPSTANSERSVYTDGTLNGNYANSSYGAAAACLFNPESEIYADRRTEGADEPSNKSRIKIKLDEGAKLPTRAHSTDAGLDLYAMEDQIISAKESAEFNTGVHIELPLGTVGFLKSKSGLNVKHGITGEGVIDVGYTGAIKVKLYNNSGTDYRVKAGDKISQLVILPILTPELELVDELSETERGEGGFGSSGR